MRSIIFIGIALIIFGIVALTYGGVTYKTRKKVLDVGPIEAVTTNKKTIPFSPLIGVVALAGGVYLVFAGNRCKKV